MKTDGKGSEQVLAQFACEQRYEQLPAAVVERAKLVFLDTLGVMIRGASAPGLDRLRASMLYGDSGPATVIGSASKSSAPTAAFLNGCLPTVTQYDEGYRAAMGHPAIHVVPAALALAEAEGASGRDLITALVIGYEVAVRIGLAAFPLHAPLHPHGTWASLGAAVAAGKLLSFTEAQFVELLDAGSNLSVLSWAQATRSGGTVHHLVPGLGAGHAVIAALAVQAGLRGSPGCLREFFLPLCTADPKPPLFVRDLGRPFAILENYFKRYPACAHSHSALQAVEAILAEHRPTIDAIDVIEVRTYGRAGGLANPRPVNPLAGMFSIPYSVALLIVRGTLPVEDSAMERPLDPEALRTASLVRVVPDDSLRPAYPRGRPARVTMRLKDGTQYESFVDLPAEDVGREALEGKFLRLVSPVAGAQNAEALAAKIAHLENLRCIRDLSPLLSFQTESG